MRTLVLAGAVLAAAGCRGQVSEDPPIYPEFVLDMDFQAKYQAQGASEFFADGRAMRTPVEGTVSQGGLKDDEVFHHGTQNGKPVGVLPLEKVQAALHVDSLAKVMARGQERYNIYCAPCHDQTGSGKGLVSSSQRPNGYKNVRNLWDDRVRGLTDGEIYQAIAKGANTMPAYGHQIPEADRWAIVSWVRVLQRSQHATIEDVPSDKQAGIEAEDAK